MVLLTLQIFLPEGIQCMHYAIVVSRDPHSINCTEYYAHGEPTCILHKAGWIIQQNTYGNLRFIILVLSKYQGLSRTEIGIVELAQESKLFSYSDSYDSPWPYCITEIVLLGPG